MRLAILPFCYIAIWPAPYPECACQRAENGRGTKLEEVSQKKKEESKIGRVRLCPIVQKFLLGKRNQSTTKLKIHVIHVAVLYSA